MTFPSPRLRLDLECYRARALGEELGAAHKHDARALAAAKDIPVQTVFLSSLQHGAPDGITIRGRIWGSGRVRVIEIAAELDARQSNYTVAHEVGHACGFAAEESANAFATAFSEGFGERAPTEREVAAAAWRKIQDDLNRKEQARARALYGGRR